MCARGAARLVRLMALPRVLLSLPLQVEGARFFQRAGHPSPSFSVGETSVLDLPEDTSFSINGNVTLQTAVPSTGHGQRLSAFGGSVASITIPAKISEGLRGNGSGGTEMETPRTAQGQQLLPLVWLHIPKTGSSFATTIAHYGCPGIPPNVVVKEVSWENPFNHSALNVPFSTSYPAADWCSNSFASFYSGHSPIPWWARFENVVSMFREPKRRLLSGYFHNYHDCLPMRKEVFCEGENLPCHYLYATPMWRQKQRLRQYSQCVRGCEAHMLAGNACGVMGSESPANESEAEQKALSAMRRLGFVGITEQWPLSICLFHAKFGGRCYNASFRNVRLGKAKHKYGAFLKFVDDSMVGIDSIVYDAANKRFWQDVDKHNVSIARCRQEICPEGAEFFKDDVSFELDDDDF